MKLLKQFYNEEIKIDGMPDFEVLSERMLNNMKKSMSFSVFNAKNAFRKSKLKWRFFRFLVYATIGAVSLFMFYAFILGVNQIFGW